MKIAELISDAQGRLSHTRLWANIAYLAATVIVARMGWAGNLNADIFVAYLLVVGASPHVSKYMDLKYGTGTASAAQPEASQDA